MLPTAARGLPPTQLLETSLKEFGGFGIIHVGPLLVKGACVFNSVPQLRGKIQFLFQLTPTEWGGEGKLMEPPLAPLLCTMKAINGWLKLEIPGWGRVMILAGDSEIQRLLMERREQSIPKLRVSMSQTHRHILFCFGQEW